MKKVNRIWVALSVMSMLFAQSVGASEGITKNHKNEVLETLVSKEKPSEVNVAISKGDVSKVQQLVNAGADVNQKDSAGKTPLMYAILYKNSEIVSYLIEKGAKVSTKDARGYSVMDYALDSKSDEIIQQIKQARKRK